MALPNAWNTEDNVIATAAPKKLGAIVRKAGIPILSISSEALNISNKYFGNNSKANVPKSIMQNAINKADFIVFVIRFRFFAP